MSNSVMNENIMMNSTIKYASIFSELNELVSFITEDVKSYPSDIQHLFYNYSYFDISNGLIGNTILLEELDELFPDKGFGLLSYNILKVGITREFVSNIDIPSLWAGLSGICYTIHALSKKGTRYVNLLNECDKLLKPLIAEKLREANHNLQHHDVKMTDFDIIEGLSGIGLYLIEASDRDPDFQSLLDQIILYLIKLTNYKTIDGKKIPNWHVSSQNQFLEVEIENYQEGNLNLGQSHGIAGVLSLLSLVVLNKKCTNEAEVTGRIRELCTFFMDYSMHHDGYIYWEKKMPLEHYLENSDLNTDELNFSWCYGDLMIARALWLAGRAIENDEVKGFSMNCFQSYQHQLHNHKLVSPSYCHGIAGALHIIIEMKKETNHSLFEIMEEYLLEELMSFYKEDAKFGFQDIEEWDGEINAFDKTGLLTGATGIYLVLLYYQTKQTVTNWPRLFGIS